MLLLLEAPWCLWLGTQALADNLSVDSRPTINSCAILDQLLDLSEYQFSQW